MEFIRPLVGSDSTIGSARLAIENKIHAAEQPEQLLRYARFLQSRYRCEFHIYYLTLDDEYFAQLLENPLEQSTA